MLLRIKLQLLKEPSAFTADSDESAAQALFRVVLVAPPSSFYSCSFFLRSTTARFTVRRPPELPPGGGGACGGRVSVGGYCVEVEGIFGKRKHGMNAVLYEEKSNYEKEKTYCLCSSNTIHGNFENIVMVK